MNLKGEKIFQQLLVADCHSWQQWSTMGSPCSCPFATHIMHIFPDKSMSSH